MAAGFNISALDAALRCTVGHGDFVWPLVGSNDEGVALLARGRCPLCPDEPLEAQASGDDLVCGCCGSTWRMHGEEVDVLPGPRTSLV